MRFVHTELKRDTWIRPAIEAASPDAAVKAVQELIKDLDREMVVTLHLANNCRVISAEVSAIGVMDEACLSPAEVLRTALLTGCRSIILLHAHPSGNAKASDEDIQMTKKIAMAADLLGIKFLDHIVIGGEKWVSIKDLEPEIFERRDTMELIDYVAEGRR